MEVVDGSVVIVGDGSELVEVSGWDSVEDSD